VRFWTGYSTITWEGEDWTGAGNLGSIGSVQQSITPEAPGMRFSLTGIDSAVLSSVFNFKYRNRTCELFMAFLNDDFDTVLASYRLFGGRMSVPIVNDQATTGSIVIEVENELADMMRPNAIRYTDEHQRRIFPTDTGLRYIASVANKRILWGREQIIDRLRGGSPIGGSPPGTGSGGVYDPGGGFIGDPGGGEIPRPPVLPGDEGPK
jgi:hypothetical protein